MAQAFPPEISTDLKCFSNVTLAKGGHREQQKFKTTFYFEHFSEKMADEDPNLELKKKIKEAFQVAC
jgi:hypothetical protein